MRAAFQDAARDPVPRLAWVVALVFMPATRVCGDAAGLRGIGGMLRGVIVRCPFPDIADHVVEVVAVGREGRDRGGALEAILREVLPREVALPGVRHVLATRRELVAPGELRAV